MKIQSIVEGFGEVAALPILLRRLLDEASVYNVEIARPIRRSASDINSKARFQEGIQLALRQPGCGAILILFDLDEGCPKEKATELAVWATEIAKEVPTAVVLAHREYEAWFLAALESLRGYGAIRADATYTKDPESVRGAKAELERWMPANRIYAETVDQARLTAALDLSAAYHRSRSFRRLVSAFGQLLIGMGLPHAEWPPQDW
jgi:hypothetical protein